MRDRTDASILVIEHDMPLLAGLCDELCALDLGAVLTRGTPDDVLRDPRVIERYLGNDSAAINRSGAEPRPATTARKRKLRSPA